MQDTTVAERFAVDTMPSVEALESFNVSTPKGRALLLSRIQEGKESFSPEQQTAYGELRDGVVKLARGQGSTKELQQYAQVLGVFLRTEEAPSKGIKETQEDGAEGTKRENVDVSAPITEERTVPIAQKAGPTVSSAIEEVLKADTTPSFVASVAVAPKMRRGPDIRIDAPTPLEVARVSEEVIAPIVAEESKSEVEEVAEAVSTTIESLSGKIDYINDKINEFAHGKAFQWLSNPDTRYKEYMNELIAIRAALSVPDVSEAELTALAERVAHLEEMAGNVRKAVGGEAPVVVADAQGTEMSSAWGESSAPLPTETAVLDVEGPVVQKEVSPKVEVAQVAEEVPVVAEHFEENLVSPVLPPVEEVVPPVADAPQAVEEGVEVVPVEETPLAQEVSQVSTEMSAPEVVEQASESSILTSPEVTTALENLLIQWLGTTGWFSLGDSGLKHPDWLAMKDLRVNEISVEDGFIPKGLRPETLTNLSENIRAWSVKYGLYPEGAEETVEHFMRRVVHAGMGGV